MSATTFHLPLAAMWISVPPYSLPIAVRNSGVPPSPMVTYAPPVPWNEMSFGPLADEPSGNACESRPSTTRDCLPFHSRVIAPDLPKQRSSPAPLSGQGRG